MPAERVGFWRTLATLLLVARRRAVGRNRRRRQLFNLKTGARRDGLGILAALLLAGFMAVVHFAAAKIVVDAVTDATELQLEREGKVLVSPLFKAAVDAGVALKGEADYLSSEALQRVLRFGGTSEEQRTYLKIAVHTQPASDFVTLDDGGALRTGLADARSLSAVAGSLALLLWLVMLTCQGEGLELDVLRRRHPVWEWLFSHPVPGSAVFAAEMLAPIAANPIYLTAPAFLGILYGAVYGAPYGLVGGLLAGVPLMLAASCAGKAVEVFATLRLSVRTRGPLIGMMSWLGFALMTVILLLSSQSSSVANVVAALRKSGVHPPLPWLGWFLGVQADGTASFARGIAGVWCAAAASMLVATGVCVWSAGRGLAGSEGSALRARAGSTAAPRRELFAREPLFRKEVLWLLRDRSAIVQALFVPCTLAGLQVFNLSRLVTSAPDTWNVSASCAILFGTYFLWTLGPRSLGSEGAALWLPQTWPGGIEALMRAKARLWFWISTALVAPILLYGAFNHPSDAWKYLLIAAGWAAFGWSMALKSVTLVSAPSASGEPEPIPKGRRWAASLGMLTFASGVVTGQWHLAVVGVVFSGLTAAAMWQNFNARLPFLFDPWSETLLPPPTLTQAMIAISAQIDLAVAVTAAVVMVGFHDGKVLPSLQVLIYGSVAAGVALVTARVLKARGLRLGEVWIWGSHAGMPRRLAQVAAGAAAGVALGALAAAYMRYFDLKQPDELLKNEQLKLCYTVIAVAIAPFAEEYLFRGLLYRSLDRDWGGWRALLASALFFGSYHPPVSWLPVTILGLANAGLFKKTGNLFAAVALHAAYNATVLW
jgi:membrane protease YdiL (CAAX protease family)